MIEDKPMEDSEIRINASLVIPLSELEFRTSRSGGPGGQHVNTSDTKVELLFNVETSPSLTEKQRERLKEALGKRLDTHGFLHVYAQQYRSQNRNRIEAIDRFVDLLRTALKPRLKRKATKPSKASKERRLQNKRERTEKKERRKKVDLE